MSASAHSTNESCRHEGALRGVSSSRGEHDEAWGDPLHLAVRGRRWAWPLSVWLGDTDDYVPALTGLGRDVVNMEACPERTHPISWGRVVPLTRGGGMAAQGAGCCCFARRGGVAECMSRVLRAVTIRSAPYANPNRAVPALRHAWVARKRASLLPSNVQGYGQVWLGSSRGT